MKKPITYFHPRWVKEYLEKESLTDLEKEMLIHFDEIWNDDLRKLAINLVRELAEFVPRHMVRNVIIGKRSDEEIQKEIKTINYSKREKNSMKLETKVRFQITWARIRKWSWLLFLILLFFIIIEFNAYITSPILTSISSNSFLTALIGAIVGGVVAFWGSVYVQQNQVKATSAIQRRDIIFIPVYNELLKLKKSLFEYPCPSAIDFSGKKSYHNNPDFTVWPAFKEDSRHLQMPKSLSDSLDQLMVTCEQYSDEWQIASTDTKVEEVIKDIIVANSVENWSQGQGFTYKFLPCNNNFSRIKKLLISYTSRKEQIENHWQLIPTKSDKELEEIAIKIYDECTKIESVKQLQKSRDTIDSKLEELIKSLELAIRFINEKVEGNERWV